MDKRKKLDPGSEECIFLFKKGYECYENGQHELAFDYFSQAEKVDPKGYPDATYYKGFIEQELGHPEAALILYTKAEDNSPDGHPNSSFNKGVIYRSLGQTENALVSYTKAEDDSPNGDPEASNNKGFAYESLNQLEDALLSYTKAENDSHHGYPHASHSKGLIYYKIGQFENAIVSWTKAEHDSIDGHPRASYNKGVVYNSLNQTENALISYTKAEDDSPNGFPNASFNKGRIYKIINQPLDALSSYTKAEKDSSHGYPEASYSKGLIYHEIDQLENALLSYTQAENDSPDCHPVASYNKGIIYFPKNLRLSAESFHKSIRDSAQQVNPKSHMWLSKCFHGLEKHGLAKKFAYLALKQDNHDYEIIDYVLVRYGNQRSKGIYTLRLKYLLRVLENHSSKDYGNEGKIDEEIFNRFIENMGQLEDSMEVFHMALSKKEVALAEDIDYQERLRLSYLIYFLNGEYHSSFHLLETDLYELYGHSDMDHYIYFLSAYLIGEPVDEFNSYLKLPRTSKGIFSESLLEWSEKVRKAIENNSYLDKYLLDIQLPNIIIGTSLPLPEGHHPWVRAVLESIRDPSVSYDIPLGENELLGLLPQFFEGFSEQELSKAIFPEHKWRNIVTLLENSNCPENYRDLVMAIREGIGEGIPYLKVLVRLIERTRLEKDTSIKKNLVILQAAVLLSERFDSKREMPIDKKIAIDIFQNLAFDGVLYLMNITTFGLGAAMSTVLTISNHVRGNNRKERVRSIFEVLLTEIV
ncbi:Tetratricopeptide (TPR) repeat [Pricia antarctica]|uniref:Tetratricopeptide (TPR) repeat n=1 Tax=Pricia antarctica TaxID=641691 RepID=A0A1G6XC57_9FLAO|nr:tetratricopeptide repeat protein [Pricia antarctica]SDD74856.1 Tetratricopeptide (TPR) repeat [Pricia antarctica]